MNASRLPVPPTIVSLPPPPSRVKTCIPTHRAHDQRVVAVLSVDLDVPQDPAAEDLIRGERISRIQRPLIPGPGAAARCSDRIS